MRTCVFAIACSPLAVRSALSCVRHMNVGIFGHLLRLSDTTSINLEPQVSAGVRTANYELRQLRHCDTATLRLASCDTVDCDTANKMQTATPCTATPRHRDTATCKLRHRGLRHCKQNAHCDTTTPRHSDIMTRRHNDTTTQHRHCDTATLWDTTTLRHYGTLRHCDTATLRHYGTLRHYDTTTRRQSQERERARAL